MADMATDTLKQLAFFAIGERLRAITGSTKSSLEDFAVPAGDPGLFGPASMVWRVHEHFTAMMVGGLSSLIVQALHPRALAAVWDHSQFRDKLKDRLSRTAFFVAATTYGSEVFAMKAIQRVNAIHSRITGTDLQGRPYVANEPVLLNWVHLVEATSFLAAYQHLAETPLSPAEADQYMAEMAVLGHLLGGVDLPSTVAAAEGQMRSYQAELRFDERAQEVVRLIASYPTDVLDKPFMGLVLESSFDLMPDWVLQMLGRSEACALPVQARRLALQLASEPLQWMLDEQGVAAVARRRVHLAA
ncbi:Domain of unknown function DUF2236 [Burkholderiaceae bacterium]